MVGLGGTEVFLLLLAALVIFGPQKLPELGRSLGKAIREFRSAGSHIQDEVTKVTDEVDPEKIDNPPKST